MIVMLHTNIKKKSKRHRTRSCENVHLACQPSRHIAIFASTLLHYLSAFSLYQFHHKHLIPTTKSFVMYPPRRLCHTCHKPSIIYSHARLCCTLSIHHIFHDASAPLHHRCNGNIRRRLSQSTGNVFSQQVR